MNDPICTEASRAAVLFPARHYPTAVFYFHSLFDEWLVAILFRFPTVWTSFNFEFSSSSFFLSPPPTTFK